MPPHLELHDYGCGVERPLSERIGSRKYHGVDRAGSGADLEVDLNGTLSAISIPGERSSRIATVIGLLEYLDDVPRFVAWLATHYDTVLLTYVCNDHAPRRPEWKNAYTREAFLAILDRAFATVEVRPDVYNEGDQLAFVCSKAQKESALPIWATIAGEGRLNYGNDIIEAAIDAAVPGFRAVSQVYPLWSLQQYRTPGPAVPFVFVPGSTVLCIPAMLEFAARCSCRTIMLGASMAGATSEQLAFWKSSPRFKIFARDPITANTLNVPLVGCPTLFCPTFEVDGSVANKVLFSVSGSPIPVGFWKRDFSDWIAVLHEERDAARIPNLSRFSAVRHLWDMTGHDAIRMYQSAGAVVAGRLHGYLPAVGHIPSWYFGDPSDIRNSLVPHVGLTVHSAAELAGLDLDKVRVEYPTRISKLRAAFQQALTEIE